MRRGGKLRERASEKFFCDVVCGKKMAFCTQMELLIVVGQPQCGGGSGSGGLGRKFSTKTFPLEVSAPQSSLQSIHIAEVRSGFIKIRCNRENKKQEPVVLAGDRRSLDRNREAVYLSF